MINTKNDSNELMDSKIDNDKQGQLFPFQIMSQVVHADKGCSFQDKLIKYGVSDYESYKKIIEQLNNEIASLTKKNTTRSRGRIKSLKLQLAFLEKNKPYIREMARQYMDFISYTYLEEKSENFLRSTQGLKHLKKEKGLIKQPWIFLFPNEIHCELNRYGQFKKVESSSGNLILNKLRFFFVDIDKTESWEQVELIIQSFGLRPDVVIQTSKKKFHCYWSIEHLDLDTQAEDKKGRQIDQNIILYQLGLKALIEKFKADPKRSNATSQMRAPNTWNIKSDRHNKFKTKYWNNSRTLEDALKSPKYTFDQIINHIFCNLNEKIYEQAKSELDSKTHNTKLDDSASIELNHSIKDPTKTFDFKAGWEDAFISFKQYFNLPENYFTENDLMVLKYIWTLRSVDKITFSNAFRKSLSGSGNKYGDLNLSIEKISSLPKRIGSSNHKLIKVADNHQRATSSRTGKKKSYQISKMFLEACGKLKQADVVGIFNWIYNKLYVAGERNDNIPKDIYVLKNILNKTKAEAYEFLINKIQRSSNQENHDRPCKNDTSNVMAYLRYYYSEGK